MSCHGASVGVIVRQGNLGLFIQRARGPKAGTWAFPAGHREIGEIPAQTATREVFEEVGLELDTDDLALILAGRFADECRHGTAHHNWTVYEAEVPDGQFAIRDETETLGMRWVPLTEWGSLDLDPVWRKMLTAIGYIDQVASVQ